MKGIGFSLSDNIKLFEGELKKLKNGDKKIKEYKYMLEHTYGWKGKKTDYSPWSCTKIASKATPGFGEVYGCPYVFYAWDKLTEILV